MHMKIFTMSCSCNLFKISAVYFISFNLIIMQLKKDTSATLNVYKKSDYEADMTRSCSITLDVYKMKLIAGKFKFPF